MADYQPLYCSIRCLGSIKKSNFVHLTYQNEDLKIKLDAVVFFRCSKGFRPFLISLVYREYEIGEFDISMEAVNY